MVDAGVVLQVLGEDEQVLGVQALVLQGQLDDLVCLYVVQGHVPAVDRKGLDPVLEDELGEVLQAELIHLRVLEVDLLGDLALAEVFVRQDWVPDDLPEHDGSLDDVLLELCELFLDLEEVLVAMLGILVEQLDYDLAHVVREDLVLEEVRDLVDIRVRRDLMQIVLRDIPGYQLRRRPSKQQFEHDRPNRVDIAQL